jgi:glycosyltransferase involved in cell wall biosynthesis
MFTAVEPRPIPQPYKGVVIFEIRYQEDAIPVAVDYYDYEPINRECLERVPLYFKMQYRRSGYDDPRILPGGYIAGKQALYDYYSNLRELRRRPHAYDVYARFGTFNTRSSNAIRRQAVALLEHDDRFAFAGGTSLALYMQYLREAARARVCIDMPGNGPFCFRLVEYLAMGCCVVAPRHATVMPAELQDREHIVYCQDDLSDLADLCMHYVENDQAREAVAANAARFFDEHLQPAQLAGHYLRVFSERLRRRPTEAGRSAHES